MKILKSTIIYVFVFLSAFFIVFLCVQDFGPRFEWSSPVVIDRGWNSVLGQCGDNLIVVYVSNVSGKEALYSSMSRDGEEWSDPHMLSMQGEFYSTPSIVKDGDEVLVFWSWRHYTMQEEKTRKKKVYYVKTGDCRNWSQPREVESFPFRIFYEGESGGNDLESVIKLKNGKYAALYSISYLSKDKILVPELYYSESNDLSSWFIKETIPQTTLVGSAQILEEDDGKVILVFYSGALYLMRRENGQWSELNTILYLGPNIHPTDPSLIRLPSGKYWLFFKIGALGSNENDIYYMISPDLENWNKPIKVTDESRRKGNISSLMTSDGEIWIAYTVTKYEHFYNCDLQDPEYECDVRIKHYVPHGNVLEQILNYLFPLLAASAFTGFTALILRFIGKEQ